MKMKTSITLSEETLALIDTFGETQECKNRSELIETAVLFFLLDKKRQHRDERDLELINTNAKELNQEAEDILSYQPVNW